MADDKRNDRPETKPVDPEYGKPGLGPKVDNTLPTPRPNVDLPKKDLTPDLNPPGVNPPKLDPNKPTQLPAHKPVPKQDPRDTITGPEKKREMFTKEVRTGPPYHLSAKQAEQITYILKIAGADSMSQITALAQIKEVVEVD